MLRRTIAAAPLALMFFAAACSGSNGDVVDGAANDGDASVDASGGAAPSGDDAGSPSSGASSTDAGADAHEAGPPPKHLVGPSPVTLSEEVGLAAGPVACAGASCDAQRTAFFHTLADLGVHKIRTDLRWADVAPAKGTMDFSGTDRVVNAATAAHVDVLGILDYSATWANAHHDQMYPPDNFADFTAYATALVSRYATEVHHYEVWNEPNAGFQFWKSSFGGDPQAFGRLVAQTTAAIDALHLTGGSPQIAPGGTVFLSQFVPVYPFGTIPSGPDFAHNAFSKNPTMAAGISAFAFHGYDMYPPRNAPESAAIGEVQLGDKIAQTAAVLEQAGYTFDKPLWLSEIGWPTANGVDDDAQARWLIRSVLLAALSGVQTVYLYTLRDGDSPPAWSFSPEASFGVLHADNTPKAAYVAIKTMLGQLGSYRVASRLHVSGAPADFYALELAGPTSGPSAKRAWVAWRSDDGQGATTWTLPAHGAVRVLDMLGAPRSLPPTVTQIQVTRDPVYVIE